MTVSRFWAAFLVLFIAGAASEAADLSTISRAIRKEPAYRTGKPKYCLLVFGSEAKARVWLVQDGDTLYVDRNGNGDLTEEGEKVSSRKSDDQQDGEYVFKAGVIRDGTLLHKGLELRIEKIGSLADRDPHIKALLAKKPDARGYCLLLQAEIPGWKGSAEGGRVDTYTYNSDVNGVLQFGDSLSSAPIVYFCGPRHITQLGQQRLLKGRQLELRWRRNVRSRPGSTSFLNYDGVVPKDAYPTVEIVYAPESLGSEAIRETYELKQRC